MRAGVYAPPELTKYALVEGVGQNVCSPSNSSADCSCDCCFDNKCTNVGSFFIICDNGVGCCNGVECCG